METTHTQVCVTGDAPAAQKGNILNMETSMTENCQSGDRSFPSASHQSNEAKYSSNGCVAFFQRLVPSGGFIGGAFSLAGSSIGAGVLGLPYGFYRSGLIPGTLYLVCIFFLTVFSMRLLALVSVKTGIRSYESIGHKLFGQGSNFFVAVIIFFKCYGACIAYVISVGDAWAAFFQGQNLDAYYHTDSFRRVLMAASFIAFMWPLSLPKRINSLRYASLFAVIFMIYFCVCVVVHVFLKDKNAASFSNDIVLVGKGNNAVGGLGVFMFAYLCQTNMFEVWNEMRPQSSVSRLQWETFCGMLVCTVLYWVVGVAAYIEFRGALKGSLLTMYRPADEVYLLPAYIGVIIKLCVAYALHILPSRDALHHIIGWDLNTVPWWKNALLCTVMCAVSLVVGMYTPNVNVVFNLLGSLTGSFIGFVFPSIFFMYSGHFDREHVGFIDYYGTYVLLIVGVIAICFGTTATIFSMI